MTEDLVSDVRPAPSGVASSRLLRHVAPDRPARVSWLSIAWLVRDLIPANTFVIPGRLASPTLLAWPALSGTSQLKTKKSICDTQDELINLSFGRPTGLLGERGTVSPAG